MQSAALRSSVSPPRRFGLVRLALGARSRGGGIIHPVLDIGPTVQIMLIGLLLILLGMVLDVLPAVVAGKANHPMKMRSLTVGIIAKSPSAVSQSAPRAPRDAAARPYVR